jgi:predicted acetyltransferase
MTAPLPPPLELLSDGVVELRVLRILGPGDAASRTTNEQFLARVPEYRFAIHRRADALRVGRIHLRVTNDFELVSAVGHSGYVVDEAHRRNGYAGRAVTLIVGLARFWSVSPLWIIVEPANVASRRTVERAGLRLVDELATPPDVVGLGVGPRICRYRSE